MDDMDDTVVSFTLDKDLKRDMDTICDKLGLDTIAAFRLFAKAVVRTQSIPFALALQPEKTPPAVQPKRDLRQSVEDKIDAGLPLSEDEMQFLQDEGIHLNPTLLAAMRLKD